jgi:protein-disulfide isomerase
MKAVLGLLSIIILFSLGACSESNSKPSYSFKRPEKEGIAAKTGDIVITDAELRDGIESELYEAESKVFDIKFNHLKGILLQKFMDKDPKKKGLSNDEYLEKFVAKNVGISDKDIDHFIKEQNIPSEHINPQVKEKIKNYLVMEKKKETIDKWIAEKTNKNEVEVYIQKPIRPTFPIEIGNSPMVGGKDAKVTIIEFSDFQCPFCAKGADVVTVLKKKYGDKIKVAFKNFPLPFHNHAETAAVAGLCANEQGVDKFWKMHDLMFTKQDSLDLEGLKKMAKDLGLVTGTFEKCLGEKKYLSQVKSDIEEGTKIKVKSTPTFFVNGQLINGAQPIEVFSELIDEALSK